MSRPIPPSAAPESGYALVSSRRYPREPRIECMTLSPDALLACGYVGTHRIDGTACNAWRVSTKSHPVPFYVFQTRHGDA